MKIKIMDYEIQPSKMSDAKEILELQKLAFLTEAERYHDYTISPLTQTLDEIIKQFSTHIFLMAVTDKIIGTVRAYEKNKTCYIGRLAVHPEFRNQGIASALMKKIQGCFKPERYELFVGSKSLNNIRLYEKLGYTLLKSEKHYDVELLYMDKKKDTSAIFS